LLNGIVDYDFWLPWSGLANDEARDFLKKYQEKAPAAGVDTLGYYLPPFGYAYMQVLQQAVEGVGGLDQDKLADYLRSHTFKTVVGDIKFGPTGEWAEARVMEVQFRGIKNNDVDQFRDPKTEVILWPPNLKTGDVIYPYTDAKN
jgi:branched-chain amino acid transport system substrate-binding protein